MTFSLPQLRQDVKKLLPSSFENEDIAGVTVLRFGKF